MASVFNTARFNAAVARFKTQFSSHQTLYLYGQFYVTRRTFDDLIAAATNGLSGFPLAASTFIPFLRGALSQFPPSSINVAAITQQLDQMQAIGIDVSALRSLLTPGSPDVANAQSDHNKAWSTPDIVPVPVLSPPSFRKYVAAYNLEKSNCFVTAGAFATKLLKARGAPAQIPAASRISDGQIAGVKPPQEVVGNPQLQNIVYTNLAALSTLLMRIKAVLDLDCVLRCGVLSGLRHEQSVFPNPEHFILLIAHDTIGGHPAFLFWDPDAATSDIAAAGWGQGFGMLIANGARLSTALDDVDLNNLNPTGEHVREPRRHRYQVYSVQSFPV